MSGFKMITASKMSIAKRKQVYGVGINDADYIIEINVNGKRVVCPYYSRWKSMLQRCYDPKFHEKNPTYSGCSVCDDWLTFSNFRAWMTEQDWRVKELDKDLLIPGNKVYSQETCLFVPMEINMLLNNNAAKRGKWPIGVHFHKARGKFEAQCNINGKLKHLGYFRTPEEAHQAYVEFKEDHVHQIALKQEEPLKTALLNWKLNE